MDAERERQWRDGMAKELGLRAIDSDYPAATAPVPTLKRAINGEEALLDRLNKLDETIHRLAALIGGPVPVSTATGIGSTDPGVPSLMERINDLNDACHARVSDIEHSFAAMCRALGAEE